MLQKRLDIVEEARGNAFQVFNEALVMMFVEPATKCTTINSSTERALNFLLPDYKKIAANLFESTIQFTQAFFKSLSSS